MMSGRNSFGALVRREREAKQIGLREMAKMIGVSATYLSKIERDELDPPAEDKVKTIAAIIGRDVDELLALAGRVSSDLTAIIRRRPREMADLLRASKRLTDEHVAACVRFAQELAKGTAGSSAMPQVLKRDKAAKQLSGEGYVVSDHGMDQEGELKGGELKAEELERFIWGALSEEQPENAKSRGLLSAIRGQEPESPKSSQRQKTKA